MQTIRTETGYRLGNIEVDSKPHSNLPVQQARTLLYLATGMSQKAIANEMGLSPNTVNKRCADLSYKLNSHSMRQTLHNAIQQGVLRYMMCLLLCLTSGLDNDIERSFRTVRPNTARTVRARRLRKLQNKLLAA